MKVALTGATGLVGGELVPLLLGRGHDVRALVRPRPGRSPEDLAATAATVNGGSLEWVAGRLDQPERLAALVEGCDAVVHLAYEDPGASSPRVDGAVGADGARGSHAGDSEAQAWLRTNVLGSLRLLELTAATSAQQFVYASSLAVFGAEPDRDPLAERFERDESYPVWPPEFYGALRAGVEKMVFAAHGSYGWNASSFRLGAVLGARAPGSGGWLERAVGEAAADGRMGTPWGGYALAASDAALALADALGDRSVAGGVFHVFDRWLDAAELAAPLAELLGRPVEPPPAASEPRRPIRNDRIRARFGSFRTDEVLRALLEGLVARLGSGG